MRKVLLVEDEKILRDAYSILLGAQEGLDVTVANNGQEALDICGSDTFDLILLDLMMPVLNGVGFLQEARLAEKSPRTRVVVMSNLSSGEDLLNALALGAHRHAVKSDLSPNEVIKIVNEELGL